MRNVSVMRTANPLFSSNLFVVKTTKKLKADASGSLWLGTHATKRGSVPGHERRLTPWKMLG
jgi:hypothetical protein